MKTLAGRPNGRRYKRTYPPTQTGGSHGTPLSTRESQTTTRALPSIFGEGMARFFWKSRAKKEAHSTRIPRRRLRASRGRGEPDGGEGSFRVHIHTRPTRLRLSTDGDPVIDRKKSGLRARGWASQ
jgi:hypothetical protein